MNIDVVGAWLGRLLLAGYAALTLRELLRFFRTALAAPGEPAPEAPAPTPRRRLWLRVLAAFLASRAVIVLACAAGQLIDGQPLSGFFPALWGKLMPWDAQHYIDIIENGYVATGDARLFIVFFPFYPMVCRSLAFMTGIPAVAAAFAVSNAALVAAGAALYRLAELDGGGETGLRAMLLMMFCPVSYFYSITYSESVFLLATLLAVLFARRRQFVPAVLFGAIASSARLLGMATAIPIFWELLRRDREARFGADETPSARRLAGRAALCALKTLPVGLGFAGYLGINYSLFGNPTQFMVFQSEHWFQKLGTLANTFRYSLANGVGYDDFLYRLGVWWPQVVLLVAVPLLIHWRGRRARPGDAAYALAYHYVAFAPTWLLSGLRYATANYALYPILAGIPRRRWHFAAMLALEAALLAGMTWVGLWRGKVY